MIAEEHQSLLVTCHLGQAQKAALAETITDRATIVFLDELDAGNGVALGEPRRDRVPFVCWASPARPH